MWFNLYEKTGDNEFTLVNNVLGTGEKIKESLLKKGKLPIPDGAVLIDIDLEDEEDEE